MSDSEEKEPEKNDSTKSHDTENILMGLATAEDMANELARRGLQFFIVVNDGSMKNSVFNSFCVRSDPDRLIGAIEQAKMQMIITVLGATENENEETDEDEEE